MKPAEVNTLSETKVEVTRSFRAAVELVWKAFTVPELVRRWLLRPPGVICSQLRWADLRGFVLCKDQTRIGRWQDNSLRIEV